MQNITKLTVAMIIIKQYHFKQQLNHIGAMPNLVNEHPEVKNCLPCKKIAEGHVNTSGIPILDLNHQSKPMCDPNVTGFVLR